jgi:hypothetical protein
MRILAMVFAVWIASCGTLFSEIVVGSSKQDVLTEWGKPASRITTGGNVTFIYMDGKEVDFESGKVVNVSVMLTSKNKGATTSRTSRVESPPAQPKTVAAKTNTPVASASAAQVKTNAPAVSPATVSAKTNLLITPPAVVPPKTNAPAIPPSSAATTKTNAPITAPAVIPATTNALMAPPSSAPAQTNAAVTNAPH